MNEDKLFEKLDEITKLLETMNLFLQEKLTYMEDVDSALLRVSATAHIIPEEDLWGGEGSLDG